VQVLEINKHKVVHKLHDNDLFYVRFKQSELEALLELHLFDLPQVREILAHGTQRVKFLWDLWNGWLHVGVGKWHDCRHWTSWIPHHIPSHMLHVSNTATTTSISQPFSRTTWVSRHQKVNHSGFYWSEKWWGDSGVSWTICNQCTSLQTDNHASTSPLVFLQAGCPPATQPTAAKHWSNACQQYKQVIWCNLI